MLGRRDLEPVVAMVGRHQLERGLVGRGDQPGRGRDDPPAAQRVEHGHLLLVEQPGLDDLGHDHVGGVRQATTAASPSTTQTRSAIAGLSSTLCRSAAAETGSISTA